MEPPIFFQVSDYWREKTKTFSPKPKVYFPVFYGQALFQAFEGGLESGGKDNAKQTNECLLRAL